MVNYSEEEEEIKEIDNIKTIIYYHFCTKALKNFYHKNRNTCSE